MRTPNRIAITAAALVLASGLPRAQQATSDEPPVFHTRVDAVTVDVGVVDRQGRPIPGLTAADFIVTVNGRPRRVVTAEFVDVASARAEAARARTASLVSANEGTGLGRAIVFVVDEHTLDTGAMNHLARAASRLFDSLSFLDRTALISLPLGTRLEFTWAHDRVRDALQRAAGASLPLSTSEFESLSEARDIANHRPGALEKSAARECGTRSTDMFGGDSIGATAGFPGTSGSTGGSSVPAGGEGAGGGGGDGGRGAQGGGAARGGGRTSSGSSREFGGIGDSCTQDLRMRAESTWRSAVASTQISVTAMRQVLSALARVPGDKTVVLISGGWPLDDADELSLMSQVATEAAAARATIFTMYVPVVRGSATSRVVSHAPMQDSWLPSRPLQHLASMTGGEEFEVAVGADFAFARIAGGLGSYYRIGVEKEPDDNEGKGRRMKVAVARSDARVRARELFDVTTFEDRDWTARMAAALHAPTVATGIGLRVTSYVAAEPGAGTLKVMLTGEASRVEPGAASIQLLLQDSQGRTIMTDERAIGEPTDDGLTFTTALALAPGSYIVRAAVMDGMGRTGSVDHHVDARAERLGDFSATGPMLIRMPTTRDVQPRLALSDARQDERLAMEVQLRGEPARLADARVVFEIAPTADAPALIETDASVTSQSSRGWMSAQAVADLQLLPPGNYVTRVRVESAGKTVGHMQRAFAVRARPPVAGGSLVAADASSVVNKEVPVVPPLVIAAPPRLTVADALASPVLDPFLARVAAHPKAGAPAVRDLVRRARTSGIDQLTIGGALAVDEPVAAFLKGLTLLRSNQLDRAANAFRSALQAAPDLYPAMVYLGACFAVAGKDKEAAGMWRTALNKEGETRALHVLLADALLRQQETVAAFQAVDAAIARWPEDDDLRRRLVVSALLAGRYVEGLQALDVLIEHHGDDETILMAGLLVLYQSLAAGRPVINVEDDRARMARLAEAYRAAGGRSVTLVDTWLEAAQKR
jgi:VWFA-related protein